MDSDLELSETHNLFVRRFGSELGEVLIPPAKGDLMEDEAMPSQQHGTERDDRNMGVDMGGTGSESCAGGGPGEDSDGTRPPARGAYAMDRMEEGRGEAACTLTEGEDAKECGSTSLEAEGENEAAEDDLELPEILSKKQQRAAQRARGEKQRGGARGDQKQPRGPRQDSKATGTCDDPFEVLVIGAGPHALSMVLRLVEPCPDMLLDGERILEGLHTRHGVWSETKHHVAALRRGKLGQASVAKERPTINEINQGKNSTYACFQQTPYVPLRTLQDSVHVIDAHGEWMREWDRNFQAYEIKYLRSSVYVHPDPYQQRTLSSYADVYKKEHEQVLSEQTGSSCCCPQR